MAAKFNLSYSGTRYGKFSDYRRGILSRKAYNYLKNIEVKNARFI
jgi:hypothetical protein